LPGDAAIRLAGAEHREAAGGDVEEIRPGEREIDAAAELAADERFDGGERRSRELVVRSVNDRVGRGVPASPGVVRLQRLSGAG